LQVVVLIFAIAVFGQDRKSTANASAAQPTVQPTVASTVDREISLVEKEITEAAQAMPEDRFNFSPESLNISGADFKGVRTFAQQVKHIAASNFAIWSGMTKAEILKFLQDSFALGHKAAASLTTENMLQPAPGGKSPRLHPAEFGAIHAFDHYGQMVEYLRMNGITPPASRGQ
jgi:hypothetical protein